MEKIYGESGDVQGEMVDSWKERLPEIINGYISKIDECSTATDVVKSVNTEYTYSGKVGCQDLVHG